MYHRLLSLCSLLPVALFGLGIEGEMVQVHSVQSGQMVSGQIVLTNNTDLPETIEVELFDYKPMAGGKSDFLKPGTIERSNANWLESPQTKVVIPAKSNTIYNYTLKAPQDLKEGTYWSLLRFVPEVSNQNQTNSITQRVAYGVQIIARASTKSEGSVELTNTKVHTEQEMKRLACDVRNTSSIDMLLESQLEVYNAQGTLVMKAKGVTQRIYPETELTYNFDITKLEKGSYQAFVILDDSNSNYFGIQKQINVE